MGAMAITETEPITPEESDATAADVAWDLEPLLDGLDVDALLDRADALASDLEGYRGRVAGLDVDGLVAAMSVVAEFEDVMGRVGSFAGLRFAEDTADPARGALMAKVQERSTTIAT